MAKRYRVTLPAEERDERDRMISRGKAEARKLTQARILLQADAAEAGPGWADAAIAGALRVSVADGGRVRLGNARGECVLHVRVAEGMQPGVVVAESIWPHADHEGGVGINALTSDQPAAPAGGAVFHDTAVWMRAEAAAEGLPLAAE